MRPITIFTRRRALSTTNNTQHNNISSILSQLNLSPSSPNPGVFNGKMWKANGEEVPSINPTTGETLAMVKFGTVQDYQECSEAAHKAFKIWSNTPAPVRGDVVRQLGNALRHHKKNLGALLSLEMGKIKAEGEGEIQEYIDVCDMACGMSRQIPGQVIPSERKDHVLFETWNPLGVVGIITAFNFPVAVKGWNTAISLICGNTQIVKGAETASLSTIAAQKILTQVLESSGIDPAVAVLCQGRGANGPGDAMLHDHRVSLVSFTGSTKVGRHVSHVVGQRFGRTILELGGNNAIVVMNDANMEMALRSVMFAAVGTCGQRCTSLRRLLLHSDVYDTFLNRLKQLYANVRIGDPSHEQTLLGPLHTKTAVDVYKKTISEAISQGGKVMYGAKVLDSQFPGGNFVLPTIIESPRSAPLLREERFVPILHVIKITSLQDAIAVNNSVEQGLTSALFTQDMRNVFEWMGPNGSDTGIANVNTSCSGAEVGAAFGTEKGGNGRECGSDSWKQYMRRGTCTINFGNELPLAQGIDFSATI
jgi:aldehyde dehydrogenase family 7 protein A1